MDPFDIQRNRWIIMALAAGVVLFIVVYLTYLMMWRPRAPEGTRPAEGWSGIWHYTPWVLILAIAGIFVYAAVYTIYYSINPPNW